MLYILSVGHSGSTLLDIMLGAHQRGVSVGELTFNGPYLNTNSMCSCGAEPLLTCPNWKALDGQLAKHGPGLTKLPLAGPETEINNERFYQSLCKVAGADFVVESSKSVSRLRDLSKCTNLDLHVILLTRSPKAVLGSHVRRGRSFMRYLRAYLINVPSQTHLAGQWQGTRVAYEELVTAPIKTVERIYAETHIPGTWPARSWHETQSHLSGGNPIRFKKTHELKLDERWRSDLTFSKRLVIAAFVNAASLGFITLMFGGLRYIRGTGLCEFSEKPIESEI